MNLKCVSHKEFGYPVVKAKLDSTGQCIFCFINGVEVIE